jgi:hypothetical protein
MVFKKPVTPQDTGKKLEGNPGSVSLRQFRDNKDGAQGGQESHLMKKKGIRGVLSIYFLRSHSFPSGQYLKRYCDEKFKG